MTEVRDSNLEKEYFDKYFVYFLSSNHCPMRRACRLASSHFASVLTFSRESFILYAFTHITISLREQLTIFSIDL